MVTYRLWKRTRTRPSRAVCKRRLADVRTIACGLTIRFACRQKLDRSASAHWHGQVAISTAGRPRVAGDAFGICERGGGVRAIEPVMVACAGVQYAVAC